MTAKIILKKSSVASKTPLVGDLDYGELAINYQDGKLWYKDASNNIKAFIDSAGVQTAIDNAVTASGSYGNSDVETLVDSAYVQLRQDYAYSSLTGTPTIPALYTDFVDSAEGRKLISVTDNGGDGSLTYNNTTGVIAYTGPSATEVRAHFTAGEGVSITNGVIAIAQAVDSTEDVVFGAVTTSGDVTVGGNLTVQGTTTTLNTSTLDVEDINITIAKNAADSATANGAGFTVDGANATILYDNGNARWNFNRSLATEGTVTADGLTVNGTATITNTTTGDSLLITTTEDGSDAAPVISLKRNSGSPADGDYLGQLKFLGENDADQEVVYAKITAKTSDVTDTTEDGLLEFMVRKDGANNINARLTHADLKLINGTGLEVAGAATFSTDIDVTGTVTATSFVGDVTGNLTGIADSATNAGFANTAAYANNADTLDGQHGSYYRIDVYNSSGTLLN